MQSSPDVPLKKIAITGGPGGGKSTGMTHIVERFESLGWKVFVVPEVATLLIGGGMKPWLMDAAGRKAFQKNVVATQLALEKSFEEAARTSGQKSLVLCDRGIQDSAAYCSPEDWTEVLAANDLNEITARDVPYDAVLHLVTAADGAEAFYTLENNRARTETPAQARALDRKTLEVWTGHPHLREIRNEGSFDHKLNQVVAEVAGVLGEPEPVEAERRFLVKADLPKTANVQEFEIIQHYLHSDENSETRVRRRGRNGHFVYTRTTKERIPGSNARVEREEMISKESYYEQLLQHPNAECVKKKRACVMHAGRYLEIDTFEAPVLDHQIMEIETLDEGAIPLPSWIQAEREITGEKKFSNRNLARMAAAQAHAPAPRKADLNRAALSAQEMTAPGPGWKS